MPMVTKPTGSNCKGIIGVLRARIEEPSQGGLEICTVLVYRLFGLLKSKLLAFPTCSNALHTKQAFHWWALINVHYLGLLQSFSALYQQPFVCTRPNLEVSWGREQIWTHFKFLKDWSIIVINKEDLSSFQATYDTDKLTFLRHS